jgi:hypothetical protein
MDLATITPYEAYSEAVHEGIEVAIKRGKEAEWWADHPEFSAIRDKVLDGSMQHLREVVQQALEIPGVVGVFNV